MNGKPDFFDLTEEYDRMLNEGIRLSGEDRHYFLSGRVEDMTKSLPDDFVPDRILDFGCGVGDTANWLAQVFPSADVLGVDTSLPAIAHATKEFGSARVQFRPVADLSEHGQFDLCYVNGVFHHVEPSERASVARMIGQSLVRGGLVALFENNPWNPGTRLVMHRIPFDRDAKPLSSASSRRMLRRAGFDCLSTRYLFYFPRCLSSLRWMETSLASLPFGAQYYVLAKRA